jgi:glutamine amidotransferase
MCRVLAYVGGPVKVDDLLYGSDSSLVRQSLSPKMLHMLSLAGFGMAAWDPRSIDPGRPFLYRSTAIPVFDRNLKALAEKLETSALLAHIRGVAYHERVTVGEQNLHPFFYPGQHLALAHNGDLHRFPEMRFDLLPHIRPDIAARIAGNTDSEWLYALLVSQLDERAGPPPADAVVEAVKRMLAIVRTVRERHGIRTSSAVNLFIAHADAIFGVRFTYDFGCAPIEQGRLHESNRAFLGLWYTTGTDYGFHEGEWKMIGGGRRTDAMLLASEPLTADASTWLEVPEYSMVHFSRQDGRVREAALDV